MWEKINDTYHFDDFRINWFGKNTPSCGDVIDQFIEGTPFNLLALEVGHRVHKIERYAALPQLSNK